MKKLIIFAVIGIISVAAYDQMARKGWVPKIFKKKVADVVDPPPAAAREPLIHTVPILVRPRPGAGSSSGQNAAN